MVTLYECWKFEEEVLPWKAGEFRHRVLEAEVEDQLGRAYYGRGNEHARGYRNGYRRGHLKSAEGAIEYSVPQVADRASRTARGCGRS